MSDFLVHHGTVGMHWGVRRYQNPDGSLTPEGRKHYGYSSSPRHGYRKGEKKSKAVETHGTKLTLSQKNTLKKVERLERLKSRFDDDGVYKNLVSKYGEKGLERIVKDVDSGDAYVRALSKEYSRQQLANGGKAVAQMLSPVVSFIPVTEVRALTQLGLSAVNTMLSQNLNELRLTEKDALNIAELLVDNRVELSDTLMDKIVDSDVFDTFGYATKSAKDLEKINKKREISPISNP